MWGSSVKHKPQRVGKVRIFPTTVVLHCALSSTNSQDLGRSMSLRTRTLFRSLRKYNLYTPWGERFCFADQEGVLSYETFWGTATLGPVFLSLALMPIVGPLFAQKSGFDHKTVWTVFFISLCQVAICNVTDACHATTAEQMEGCLSISRRC